MTKTSKKVDLKQARRFVDDGLESFIIKHPYTKPVFHREDAVEAKLLKRLQTQKGDIRLRKK